MIDLILKPAYLASHNVWMWRGQANIEWPIHSSAYRRLALEKAAPTDDDITYYEKNLLKRATHRGFRIFDGHELSDFDFLARLQHHGAATRLLDATRNALVGLYFACNQMPSRTGALIGFHAYELGGYEGAPVEGGYDATIGDLGRYRHPQTWEPPNVTPRIAAQHSQFLYSSISSDPRGSLWFEECTPRMLVIAVKPRLKAPFLKALSEAFDIRDLTLFPDIFGFATANSASHTQFDYARW
ncbi:MAG TPA: FRG domain-containing protein [Allosphingosinicella sp.]|nr:FRG domain-containing protein [Allosphingosinicella sp.]